MFFANAAAMGSKPLISDKPIGNGESILVSCNETSDAVTTEGSRSCVSVDETAVSCPQEDIATWHGADQNGEASGSFGEGAELWGFEIAGDLAENLVRKIFEAH